MAKPKLSLSAKPTFKAIVNVPVPGNAAGVPVEFTFKARTKTEFDPFVESIKKMEDVEAILACACGWDLEEPFDEEHVKQMTELYLGSPRAVLSKYFSELTQARLGN